MNESELAKVKIFRFDPEVDTEPRYSEFEAPYQGRTVLDVLLYIYENMDSSIAFRWACKKTFCRGCILSVNGKPVLSCTAPAEKNMMIEPHPKFKVIKDLVVEITPTKNK